MHIPTQSTHTPAPFEGASLALQILDATPVEGISCLIAACAIRIFSSTLPPPFVAIGLSMIATRLVLKAVERYDSNRLIELTKKIYTLDNTYPKLQLIAFICTVALSYLSTTFSMLAGIGVGSFGSVTLDVKRNKLQQQANRKTAAALRP